ncbi:hypothetical protein [Emticicia aquatica]|uniref:hypothetical protein n=1 Tax=Emticicia aquatica TaxID=1681835 RepID=UPI001EEBDBBE|nr:hypothetical protein [Emticicia aquatica]
MNLKTLILCFLTAFVFWLLNSLNKSGYTTKINYPLVIKYDDSLYISTKPLPKKISVSLSSTGWDLLKQRLSSNVNPVVYEVHNPLIISRLDNSLLVESLVSVLKKSKLNYIISDTTTLHFEKRYRKKVTLKVDSLAIDLQKNFVVASLINIAPSEIILEGPESVLKNYDDTIFIKVPAKRLGTNFDDKISIPLPQNGLVKSTTEKVLVSFEVAELLK